MPLDSGLIDTSSQILLSLTYHPAAAIFLSNNMRDTTYVPFVTYPNYRSGAFLTSIKPTEYPQWTWNWKKRAFSPTRDDVITDDIRHRSALAIAKQDVISQIQFSLSAIRNKIGTGVSFQETVYLDKKLQATAFKKEGYPEEKLLEYPYVVQYSDFAGIPLRQAADDMLFAAKLDDELLMKTEVLRLIYSHKIADAKDAAELPSILEDFFSQVSDNALS